MKLSLEEIGQRMLSVTQTGFSRHPEGHLYHGFTCPNCGRHEFGTSSLPNGVSVGSCHGHEYSGNGCTFKWDRNNEADEAAAFYTMTREEWMAQKC